MSSEIALKVENISKCFEMYEKPVHRLFQTVCMGYKKFYREFWALKNVSFEVKKGECVGVIGRNGAGKSTLLQIITGTLLASSGRVETHGRIAALLELGSGFNPDFTGRDNVYMNAAVLGLSKKEIDQKYQEIVDFADIGDFINQPVKTYSSGMMIRLAFSVQIAVNPDILVVDEALSVGDIFFQQKCLRKIQHIVDAGTTVLFVTHDMGTLQRFCTRAVYLKNGNVAAIGRVVDIVEKYQNDTTSTCRDHFVFANQGNSEVQNTEISLYREIPDFLKHASEVSGNGDVEFTALDVFSEQGEPINQCIPQQKIKVVLSMKIIRDIPSGSAAGLLCTNKDGIPMFGVNTDCYRFFCPEMKVGERLTLSWIFKMPLNPGLYFFSLGLKPAPLSSFFYSRVFSVIAFTVIPPPNEKNLNTGYANIPHAEFKLERKK